jgi:pSer/pThr/pTyr-binding forkhead associated (FHA) protein
MRGHEAKRHQAKNSFHRKRRLRRENSAVRSRILIGLIAGTVGGLLGALLQEATINHAKIMEEVRQFGSMQSASYIDEMRKLSLFVGGLIGLFLGAVNGIMEGNSKKVAQGMGIGFLTGTIMGYIGLFFGQAIFAALGGNAESTDAFAFARKVIARAFGWSLLGLGIGAGAGLSTRSPKRILHGAVGGFLGGFVGGVIFDLLSETWNPVHQGLSGQVEQREVGGPSRIVGFTAIGAATGFFIGLVEELLKQAWVRVLAGKNEGKDFILDKPMNLLGRGERCDVPLYGDPSVGIEHAAIRAENRRHVLIDAGTPIGTFVNGQRIPPGGEVILSDGDGIQIGKHQIQFREKDTASKAVRRPNDAPVVRPIQIPMDGAPPIAPGYGTINNTPPMGGMAPGGYGMPATGGVEMPRLVGMDGPYSGQIFLLTAAVATVGREPDKTVALAADGTISRNHARISNENGDFIVYDNNSANGTFVNGMRISMQVLAPGDVVQFGSSKFRFE